jgi:hypothetical protein
VAHTTESLGNGQTTAGRKIIVIDIIHKPSKYLKVMRVLTINVAEEVPLLMALFQLRFAPMIRIFVTMIRIKLGIALYLLLLGLLRVYL